MKKLIIIGILTLAACGGSLSDEQRKKLREGMDHQKIMRVSESEILSGALDQGKTIYEALEKSHFDESKTDSLETLYKVKIRWVIPGASTAHEIENQLIEAYVLGMATGSLQDNIQKLRSGKQSDQYDSLLYSKPIVSKMPDGVDKLEGVWNIYLSKKDVVLALGKSK